MYMKFILTLLYAAVFATPNGAPKCTINEKGITAGMGSPNNPALGYTITAAPSGNGMMSFTIGNTAGLSKFQGILMYVTSGTDNLTHIGSFTLPDPAKYKFTDPAVCSAANIKGSPQSTLTHAAPAPADFSKPIMWQASPQEMQLPNLAVNVVIAQKKNPSDQFPQWQHLSNIPISFTGVAVANGSGSGMGMGQMSLPNGVSRVLKCTPRNK
ncbi:hypothetical protein HDV04_000083 [Boothiomyces sp. JEL0838]|nr:hypothetical protein HDV04_000083 [Boothiomyces sp. JEL0838]